MYHAPRRLPSRTESEGGQVSTEAERQVISGILRARDHPVILDIGACGGDDSEWMREACNNTHLVNVIVEPDARNMEIIRKYRRGVRTVLVQAAIADYTGMIDFHVAVDNRSEGGRSGSGSIHKPTGHIKAFPEIQFPGPQAVPCWSLDHLMTSLGPLSTLPIDVLWVDVQGGEKNLILGGQMALCHVRYLFIEAEEVELYEGQALRKELLAMLPNFRIHSTLDYNLLLENMECK